MFYFTKVLFVQPMSRRPIAKDLSLTDCTGPIQTKIISIFRAFIVSVQQRNATPARHEIVHPVGSMIHL